MKRTFLPKISPTAGWLLMLTCMAATPVADPPLEGAKQPNIIVIMADDMGFSDLGCYGGEISTPNLDRLGRNGLRFTQFYNAARCCPSRAALLTGQYPHRAGMGEMVDTKGKYAGRLLPTALTIAEALKGAGYQTWMAGKWHVGEDSLYWPRQRGFDRYYGLVSGASSYYELDAGRTFLDDNRRITPGKDFYATRAYTDKALQFIDQGQAGKPYFLYLAYTAPHWPLHAPEADVQPYLGKYMAGWDQLRRERHARQIKEGLIAAGLPLSPRDSSVTAWEEEPRQEHWDRRMAVYAAMISIMDEGIGRIIQRLEARGELENTVIFFLADNGGSAEIPHVYHKKRRAGMTEAQLSGKVGNETSYVGYENRWANASNTPFRRYKSQIHEGGIASPLILHWPAGVTKGRLVSDVAHITDIMPTCLQIAGATYPAGYNGNPLLPMDGISWMPLLRNQPWGGHREVVWEHFGSRGIRQGKWKLVAAKGAPWELYDMEKDRTELNNLAHRHPQRVAALEKLYLKKAAQAGVVNP